MAGPTKEMVDFARKVTFSDLPGSVIDQIKRILLDSIGCALGAHALDKSKIVVDFAEESGGTQQATIIGNRRTSYALAAFVNGELIHALEYDINGPLTAHVGPFVLAPILAIAEYTHASGKDLITAMAIGYELGGRVSASLALHRIPIKEPPYAKDSPHYGYPPAIFGGVAGASKLLGLNEEQTASAFGIAGASLPPPAMVKWQRTSPPIHMVKCNGWPGWVSQLATVAPLIAKKGFTGDATIMDGEWGFWQIYGSPFFKSDVLTGGLGKVWHLDSVTFKPYPCCGLNFTAIDGILKIMQENKIEPDEIEHILVGANNYLLMPVRSGTEVKTQADAQFVNTYLFAVAAYYGSKPGPLWQTPAVMRDPKINDLMKRVEVRLHPKDKELGQRAAKGGEIPVYFDSVVEVTAKGRKFTAEVAVPRRMTDDELREKFRNNAYYSQLGSEREEEVINICSKLEELDDSGELFEILAC